MTLYKIILNDRRYSSWSIYEFEKFQTTSLEINPLESKLFSNDVFMIDKQGTASIVHSSIRVGGSIPGILVLKSNKTYGRDSKSNKMLYKCIPDDKRILPFLIPYEFKKIGFSKVFPNLYITFVYNSWDNKHPIGTLHNVIGQVDVLDNYYEYQLYCKSLNASIQKFTKDTSKALKINSHNAFIENISTKYESIEDRTCKKEWKIFTIDPPNSNDFDDGFSIKSIGNNIEQLSIYISNVTVWMDVLNLWESFSQRISTIYLPDKKRPMLPTILSDCLCSLQANTTRIAFVMDIFIDSVTFEIKEIKYNNSKINVIKNYIYEEGELISNSEYVHLMNVTKELSKKYKYINSVRNSHDIVCYLMTFMNYHCAKNMIQFENGIFRSTIIKSEFDVPSFVPEDVAKFIKIWKSTCGQYINGNELNGEYRHDILEMDAYIHITSPIRRLVDLLNIIKFQKNNRIIHLSNESELFYDKWSNQLEYINTTMRSIRKVQCDCSLLHLCSNNTEVMEKEYDGYVFDKITRNDELYQFIVYISELKLTSRVTLRDNLNNFEKHKFKLYLFQDEDSLKKKIRLQLIV